MMDLWTIPALMARHQKLSKDYKSYEAQSLSDKALVYLETIDELLVQAKASIESAEMYTGADRTYFRICAHRELQAGEALELLLLHGY